MRPQVVAFSIDGRLPRYASTWVSERPTHQDGANSPI